MPRSEHHPSALDRALASSRTVAIVGPVADLDVDTARAVLAAAAAHPRPHLALEPSDGRRWRYRSGIESAVLRRDDLATDDLGALLTRVRHEPGSPPLRALLCGDYVVVDYSHGIGDGQLGVALLAALAGTADPARSAVLASRLPRHALSSAVTRHLRAHPAAIREVARLRGEHKRVPDDGRPVTSVSRWRARTRSVSAYLPAAAVTELRAWAKVDAPGASTAAVTVALWLAALRAQGADVDEHVQILMNCRRYLDPRHAAAQGNFAVAMPVALPAGASPAELAGITRRVAESGWPLAVLVLAEAKAALRRGGSAPAGDQAEAGRYDAAGRIRPSVSDLGRLQMFDHVTWIDDGRPPQVLAYLEPDGPDAVTLLVSELDGVRTFTVTFCETVVDGDLIRAALERMCRDPIGLLGTTSP